MPSVLELETLLVRLVGDGSAYMKMLAQAQQATGTAAKATEEFHKSMGQFAQVAVARMATVKAKHIIKEIADEAMHAETAMINLKSAISLSGAGIETTVAQFKGFSESLAQQTNVSKEATLSLLEQAMVRGANAEEAKKQVLIATALANGDEERAKSQMSLAESLRKGYIHEVQAALGLQHVRTESELLIRIQEKVNAGFVAAKAHSQSTAGQLKHLHEDIREVKKQFGELILESMRPLIVTFREAVQWFQGIDEKTKGFILTIAKLVGAIVAFIPLLRVFRISMAIAFSGSGTALALLIPLAIATSVWTTSVGGVTEAWVIAKTKITESLDAIDKWIRQVTDNVLNLKGTLAILTVVIITSVIAWKVLTFAITATIFVYELLHVQQIASMVLWGTYKTVMLAVSTVMWLFNTSLLAVKAMIWLTTVALTTQNILLVLSKVGWILLMGFIYAAFAPMLLIKGAIWLVNLAFTALNVTMLITKAIAIVLFFVMLAAILTIVYAVAMGVVGAFQALVSAFKEMPAVSGMDHITGLFNEWKGIIGDLVSAVKLDLGFAWQYATAAFNLAISEIKDLMPPLWEFLKKGFFALWDVVTSAFVKAFYQGIYDALDAIPTLINPAAAAAAYAMKGLVEESDKTAKAAKDNFDKIMSKGFAVEETENTRKLRDEVKKYSEDQAYLQKLKEDADDEAKTATNEYKKQVDLATKINQKNKESIELKKIDAAMAGSAEAMHRIAVYNLNVQRMIKQADSSRLVSDLESQTPKKGPKQQKLEKTLEEFKTGKHTREIKRNEDEAELKKMPAKQAYEKANNELDRLLEERNKSLKSSPADRIVEVLEKYKEDIALARKQIAEIDERMYKEMDPEVRRIIEATKAGKELDPQVVDDIKSGKKTPEETMKEATEVLKDIRELLKKDNGPPINIKPAGIR